MEISLHYGNFTYFLPLQFRTPFYFTLHTAFNTVKPQIPLNDLFKSLRHG